MLNSAEGSHLWCFIIIIIIILCIQVSCKDDSNLLTDFDKLITTLEQEFSTVEPAIPSEGLLLCSYAMCMLMLYVTKDTYSIE